MVNAPVGCYLERRCAPVRLGGPSTYISLGTRVHPSETGSILGNWIYSGELEEKG